MKKYIFYFIIIVIIIIILYKNKNENVNKNINKNVNKNVNEKFTQDDISQVYLDSSGYLPNGRYIIKIKSKNEYLSYDYNTTSYLTNLILPLSRTSEKISDIFDVSGKLLTTTSLDNPNIIFSIYNNTLYTSSNKSSFLVQTKYGIIPNNENCSMLTLPPNYTPPSNYFNMLKIFPDYTLGDSYLKLDINGKITTFKHRYSNFDFYLPQTIKIIQPVDFSKSINLTENITPGLYFIKFENDDSFLGYGYTAESSSPFRSPNIDPTNPTNTTNTFDNPSGSGSIIKTNDISFNNIFYIDANRVIYTYDIYSDKKNYFTISARNSTLQTLPMIDISADIDILKIFLPIYINYDKTITIQPFDDQTNNINQFGYPLYPAGINNNGVTQFGQIRDIISAYGVGCYTFPNPSFAKFNLYPVNFNININISHSIFITSPLIKYNTTTPFPIPDHPPYIQYSLNDLNSTNLVNPLLSNIEPANLKTSTSGLYYINFSDTNAFLSYTPSTNNYLPPVKINNFTDSTNIIFYIDFDTNIIYSTETLIKKKYFIHLQNVLIAMDANLRNMLFVNNALKINKNQISNIVCQLISFNDDLNKTIHSFDINGNDTSNQSSFANFKLYPYVNTSRNNIVNNSNIIAGLYYINIISEPNTFLIYDPFSKAQFSCVYSPTKSGVLKKTTNVYDTSYNFFYIKEDGSIYIPDINKNILYALNGINTELDNSVIFLDPILSSGAGTLKIDLNGYIEGGNQILTSDIKLNYNDFKNNAVKFQILKAIPPPP